MSAARNGRIEKELKQLLKDPPPQIIVLLDGNEDEKNNNLLLRAHVSPGEETPYSKGIFVLDICLGPHYPFEPPLVKFKTKVYHPNIDESGRICLDSLKLPPAGSWRPSLNLRQILSQIVLLFGEPGLSDPLMKEIAEQFKNDPERFRQVASEWTDKYATCLTPKRQKMAEVEDN